ncbi:inactive phospholipase C-like protein 1 [Lates japonicus]|uniref:Phosphoinositide phospholipase C n=1 Tax=Lates japonicus TaxID=270547 RepID=A0AAD3R470_LATJO|nr:inactive phospholipase C-like protein 1 [Lates japonicus]
MASELNGLERGKKNTEDKVEDPSVQKVGGGRKKTVSFSSMPSEKKVSSAADCLAFMQGGCELKKIRPNSRVYCRFYTLDQDLSSLRWEPSKKDGERARLDVSSIREVRTGKSTETFLHNGPLSEHLAEEAAFSIIHGDDYQSLDLVALSADVANIWVTGLRYLLAHPSVIGGAGGGGGGLGEGGGVAVEGSLGSKMRSEWLAAEFAQVDEDGYGIVSEDVAVATICKLCPGIKEAKVRLRFKEIQRSKEKLTSHVTREEFQEAYCELCTRPDVYFLLVQLSKDRECLDPQDLRLFLETEQGLSLATTEGCWELLRRYEPSAQGRERGLLGLDGFARYLQSPECQLLDPEHLGVCHDMNMPLSHYYVSTSYRSYLLDDQVHGRADLGGLIKALQSGCRCLELGVTDGPEGEPLLGVDYGPDIPRHHHHHHHHHAPVTIRSALEVVNKYAFLTSQYPLLVYLCQRCSPAQQRTMAQHLKKVFGTRLYTPEALPVSLGGRATTLPSPEQLKGRILIVGKKLPVEQDGSDGEVSEEDEEIGGGGPLAGRRMTIPGEEELGVVLVVPPPSQPRKLRLHKELSDLVAIARTGSRSFYAQRASHKQAQQQSPPSSPSFPSTPMPPEPPYWTLCSLGEGEAGRLTSESPEDLVMFTKRTLTRVRPSSVRLDSSNPNPQGYWKGGVQLVALNQQTPGAMLDLHRGRFSQNGGCGYVLRPAVMRDEVSYFSAHTQGCVPGVPPQTLRIKVISAHNLPKPQGSGAKGEVIDPYVVLELHGVPADCAEQRTRTAAQNLDDPLFDETFEFQAFIAFISRGEAWEDPTPHTSLFVHVAITNLRGGGIATRGLSVRRREAGREYGHVEGTSGHWGGDADLSNQAGSAPRARQCWQTHEDVQSTTASFKEQCGLPTVAKLKQCIQSLATRLQSPEGTMGATMVLKEGYPCLEPQVNLSEPTRKLLTAYDTMIAAQKQLIENADAVQERIAQVQREGMDFHEELSRLGEKEGLKGRKLNKAVESFTWNITVLKGQSDLLRGAKMDSLDALRQLALACEACGLTSSSSSTNSSSSTFSAAELHYSSHPLSGRRSSTHGNGRI